MSQCDSDMWQVGTSHLTHLGPKRWDGRREKGKKGEKGERMESPREKSSTFSLNFPAIGLTGSGEARDKVLPRGRCFALRPESRSFDKLQEVGVFLLLGLVFG